MLVLEDLPKHRRCGLINYLKLNAPLLFYEIVKREALDRPLEALRRDTLALMGGMIQILLLLGIWNHTMMYPHLGGLHLIMLDPRREEASDNPQEEGGQILSQSAPELIQEISQKGEGLDQDLLNPVPVHPRHPLTLFTLRARKEVKDQGALSNLRTHQKSRPQTICPQVPPRKEQSIRPKNLNVQSPFPSGRKLHRRRRNQYQFQNQQLSLIHRSQRKKACCHDSGHGVELKFKTSRWQLQSLQNQRSNHGLNPNRKFGNLRLILGIGTHVKNERAAEQTGQK